MDKTHRCHECKRPLHELEVQHLYHQLGNLKPGYYYCLDCISKNLTTKETEKENDD